MIWIYKINKIMDIHRVESVELRLPIFDPTLHEDGGYHSLAARSPPDSRIHSILGRLSRPFSLKCDAMHKLSWTRTRTRFFPSYLF